MKLAVRSTLFGLFILAAAACQSPTGVNATPGDSGKGDGTPAGFALASIEGEVWHDLCDSGADGEPALTQTPPGCVQGVSALGQYHADGIRQAAEPGLPGVTVSLAAGDCPGGDTLQTTLSDVNGTFTFSGLAAGAYCVSVDPTSNANQALLPVGEWTQPQVQQGTVTIGVDLHAGESKSGVDFGWDEQFSPRHVHAAIWDEQGQLQVIDTGVALDDLARPTTGLMPRGGVAGSQVFAYAFGAYQPMPVIMMTTPDGPHQVEFVEHPDYTLAVWPGNAEQPAMLAWSVAPGGDGDQSTIYVSDLAGTSIRAAYSEALQAASPSHLLVQGWSADGGSLLFSREPWGIGGYIPFAGASSLYSLNLGDGQVTPLVKFVPQGGSGLCLDALSSDSGLIASHCPRGAITVERLDDGQSSTISPPTGLTQDYLLGSARISPDAGRIAYASAAGNPDAERGWVAVSDGLSGGSQAILDTPSGFYHVVAWLNGQSLLLQGISVPCGADCATDSLWTVGVDGSNPTLIAKGDFILLTNAGRP